MASMASAQLESFAPGFFGRGEFGLTMSGFENDSDSVIGTAEMQPAMAPATRIAAAAAVARVQVLNLQVPQPARRRNSRLA